MCARVDRQSQQTIAVDASSRQNSASLEKLMRQFKTRHRPISVNFRKAVPWLPYNTERASHFIHTYPAKVLLHIPHFFISNELLSVHGDVVADPFCGSGTVLLEAVLAGRKALGSDTNPLACLVSSVKTTPLPSSRLVEIAKSFRFEKRATCKTRQPDVVNLHHWFYPHVIQQLILIRDEIARIDDESDRNFFMVCFSSCVRKVSLADPRISVPVRIRKDTYPEGHILQKKSIQRLHKLKRVNVFECFREIVDQNVRRIGALHKEAGAAKSTVCLADAKRISKAAKNHIGGVSLMVTSPPYVGAQKYIRASSLSLGWLGLCRSNELRSLEEQSIGREHYRVNERATTVETGIKAADRIISKVRKDHPLRAHIAANYLVEMQTAFRSATRLLKRDGNLVLVAGNNFVCGYPFRTTDFLKEIIQELGLELRLELIDTIKSRGLMTKRNTTANIITRESVMLFVKT